MLDDRLTDVLSLDRAQVERILREGRQPTIQFSQPGYTPRLLRGIDAMCVEFGAQIEVRFFGHYQPGFDASWLSHLPNVGYLSVDCLRSISNLEALGGLTRLEKLSLGVYNLNRPDILHHLQLAGVTMLRLGEAKRCNVDLSPLTRCHSLRELSIAGHTQGFAQLEKLTWVSDLTLRSIPKKQSLAPICGMTGLRRLKLILGGRESIAEVQLPGLEALEIIRVRGLADVGPLARFPSLRKLRIEDQLQIKSIDVAGALPELRDLNVFNCKNLTTVASLATLRNLEGLRLGRTAVDLEELVRRGLPTSLKKAAVYTGTKKRDDEAGALLRALGYD
jgi:hypothetical protein